MRINSNETILKTDKQTRYIYHNPPTEGNITNYTRKVQKMQTNYSVHKQYGMIPGLRSRRMTSLGEIR